MSAIEQYPLPSPADRRRGDRTRLHRVLNAVVGRTKGVFVDISLRGAKLRHSGALQCRSTVRIAFEWERQKFAANAEVLASRIVSLGTREGEPATYESRFRFTSLTHDCAEILSRVIVTVGNEELRTWVGNLKGFGEAEDRRSRVSTRQAGLPVPHSGSPVPHPGSPVAHGFIRCRRLGNGWEKKWTREAGQPLDGFVLPAGTDPSEITALCRAWEGMDADGRHLLRLTAEAVVQEFIGGNVSVTL